MSSEQWKDINNTKGHYQVSDLGRIRSVDRTIVGKDGIPQKRRGKVLSLNRTWNGYLQIKLGKEGKTHRVHRLVAEHFLPGDTEREVNHLDGNKENNRLDNLEWSDRVANNIHAVRTGIRSYSLDPESVVSIRKERKQGATVGELSKKYSVCETSIQNVLDGKTWGWVDG